MRLSKKESCTKTDITQETQAKINNKKQSQKRRIKTRHERNSTKKTTNREHLKYALKTSKKPYSAIKSVKIK